MTAIRDRQSDPDADEVAVRWNERPIAGDRRGLPWSAAVLLAFGLAVIGATIDMQTQNTLAWVFKVCYFVGAIGAVCAVQRRSLFGPMVQPPLILAVTVPGVVLLISGVPANSDTLARALAVGTPLINGFPTMAVTTGLTLIIGIVRLYRERDPDAPVKAVRGQKPVDKRRSPNQASARDRAARADGRLGREGGRREGPESRQGTGGRGRDAAPGRPQASRAAAAGEHPSLPLTPRRSRPNDEPSPGGGLRARRGGPDARGRDRARRGEPPRDAAAADPDQRGPRAPRRGEPGAGNEPGRRGGRGSDVAGRAGDPARGGKTPPGRRFRQPRDAAPEDLDRRRGDMRRGDVPGADRRRGTPPRSGEPRGGQQGDQRGAPGRPSGPPPRGRRPWDDEA